MNYAKEFAAPACTSTQNAQIAVYHINVCRLNVTSAVQFPIVLSISAGSQHCVTLI